MRALVVAHFNEQGIIRTDTLEFLAIASGYFQKIILVSTRLNQTELGKLPRCCTVHIRENDGYDFWSYRAGLFSLLSDSTRYGVLDAVTFINTSFVCIKTALFMEAIQRSAGSVFSGAVKSSEVQDHIQSWAFCVGMPLLQDARFLSWWESMESFNSRLKVKRNQEFGLSSKVVELGYNLDGWFRVSGEYPPASNAVVLNPSHQYWRQLYEDLGVLKIEVLKYNPHRFDLSHLERLAKESKRVNKIFIEGLYN